jgi:hypothetical protein
MADLPSRPLLTARAAGALVLAALACALGALLLGEYEFDGLMPYGAGVLFGLVIAELVVEVGRLRSPVVVVGTAVLVGAALGWAAWLSAGSGLRPYPTGGWVAVAVGAAASGLRTAGVAARASARAQSS